MSVFRRCSVWTAKNVLPTFVGFGVGWGAWSYADSSGFLTDEKKMAVAKYSIQAQRTFAEYAPSAVNDWLWPDASHSDGADDQQSSVPFSEILASCRVPEQCDWLMDHLSEAIPYFYIHDLFASWAVVHENALAEETLFHQRDMYGRDEEFARDDVLQGVWNKTLNGVLPVATGLRCMAVLTRNRENALWLEQHGVLRRDVADDASSSEDTQDGEVQPPPQPPMAVAAKRGDFAFALHTLLKERHLDSHAESEGDALTEERRAHAARAALEVLGNVNTALAEQHGKWWKKPLRALHLASRPEAPFNLVMAAPTAGGTDAAGELEAVKDTFHRLWDEVQREMVSVGEGLESPTTSDKELQTVRNDMESRQLDRDRFMHEHAAWYNSLF